MDQVLMMKLTIISAALLSCGFGVCAFMAAGQCYLSPCYKGSGLDMVWMVDLGQSLKVEIVSLVVISHSLFAFYSLFKARYDGLAYGILLGATWLLCAIMFTQVMYWGAESRMLVNINTHLDGRPFYQDDESCLVGATNQTICETLSSQACVWFDNLCQRQMVVDDTAIARFDAITSFAVLLFLNYLGLGVMITRWMLHLEGVSQKPKASIASLGQQQRRSDAFDAGASQSVDDAESLRPASFLGGHKKPKADDVNNAALLQQGDRSL
eukprot:c5830_g1_i1.p2 GENE.c5830_g1_i1~~c5830_g1_i1.p2  ORF type:complete len:284 (+),score=63.48 c5830_g1_i1:50-853(+)